MFRLRMATTADAQGLLSIYQQYIPTSITFEYVAPTVEEFSQRIETTLQVYPYLVVEEITSDGAKIVGYGYGSRLSVRKAYDWNATLSVYLDPAYTKCGLGTRIYTALINILAAQNVCGVFGCVALPNIPSERLHYSMGFTLDGIWKNAGFKNGQWRDAGWFRRDILADSLSLEQAASDCQAEAEPRPTSSTQPKPLLKITEIPQEELKKHLLIWE